MDTDTIIITSIVALAILFLLWRVYIALKRSTCCGSCGCNLMTKKERKAFEERRAWLKDKETES